MIETKQSDGDMNRAFSSPLDSDKTNRSNYNSIAQKKMSQGALSDIL